MSAVTVFGLRRSVYTRIACLALEEKAVSYTLHEVEIFGPDGVPAAHYRRHPFGRLPALLHDDFPLYETATITRYVDEVFPGPALQPDAARARARMSQVIGVLDSYAYRPLIWGVFVERVLHAAAERGPDESRIHESLAAAQVVLDALDDIVAGAPFLAGDRLTLADLHAYPMLRYFSLAPDGARALHGHGDLCAWLDRMAQRGSVRRTSTEFEARA